MTVYSQREVEYYAKMAYDIIPVFAGILDKSEIELIEAYIRKLQA